MTIIEILREEIKNSDNTLDQLGKKTGIDKAALCRIRKGGSCKSETIEKLCDYFGYELKKKARRK